MYLQSILPRLWKKPAALMVLCLGCAPAASEEPDVMVAGGASAGAGAGGLGSGGDRAAGGAAGGAGMAAGGANSAGGGAGSAGAAGGPVAGVGGNAGSAGHVDAGSGGLASGAGGFAGGEAGGNDSGGAGAGSLAGGTGGYAGSADDAGRAGTGGAASGGSSGVGCVAGQFLCEDFEAYAEGNAPAGRWERDVRGHGEILVETARAFSGAKALHVTGAMNADSANIRTPLVVDSDTVFVRFMMYTLGYPSSSGVHTRLIRLGKHEGTASGTPEASYAFAQYNGTAIEKVNSIYQRDTGTHLNDADVKNRWVCWEFAIDKTGGVGNVVPHIWLDGTELSLAPAGSSSHGMTSPSWDPIPIELFILGLDGFQSDPVRADFWIDDLVVHSERIGCPP